MAINKQGFLNEVKKRIYKNTPVGVVSSAIGLAKDIKAKNASQNNYVVMKAQKQHEEKYGHKMSPSMLKSDLEGGILSKESKEYLKSKKQIRKEL